jgi:hypothetical protein
MEGASEQHKVFIHTACYTLSVTFETLLAVTLKKEAKNSSETLIPISLEDGNPHVGGDKRLRACTGKRVALRVPATRQTAIDRGLAQRGKRHSKKVETLQHLSPTEH